MSKKPEFDVTVIGAGVVGLTIAHYLSKTKLSVLVIDSEDNFGKVTSSRNSEVIHSGVFQSLIAWGRLAAEVIDFQGRSYAGSNSRWEIPAPVARQTVKTF